MNPNKRHKVSATKSFLLLQRLLQLAQEQKMRFIMVGGRLTAMFNR
jgi:hypothetical protein